LTGSIGSIPIFKKIQNGVVLVKKNQLVATGFLTGFFRVNWVTPGHDFSYFFHQPGKILVSG
jgi:hypothetical protein